MRALMIAATGMSAQQMRVEVISNNLANMSTTGYNARRAEFADLHYQQVTAPARSMPPTARFCPRACSLALACGPAAVSVNLAQGSLSADRRRSRSRHRGRRLPGGRIALGPAPPIPATARSRAPADGLIVTAEGFPVAPASPSPMTRAASRSMRRARSTPISATGWNRSCSARSALRIFPMPAGWRRWAATSLSKPAPPARRWWASRARTGWARCGRATSRTAPSIPCVRVTELIEAQRGYELNAKVITAADQMLGATTQVR